MLLKNQKNKTKVILLTNIKDKIKSFRFKLKPIEEGICFPKKRNINTYFFCQRTDIIFTDINNKILKISPNTPSEKIIFGKKGTFYIYILKLNTSINLKIGDTLNITYSKKEKEILNKYLKNKS